MRSLSSTIRGWLGRVLTVWSILLAATHAHPASPPEENTDTVTLAAAAFPTVTDLHFCPEGDVSLMVSSTGIGPFTYRWEFNSTLLPGETNDTILLLDVSPADAGTYTAFVMGAQETNEVIINVTVGDLEPPVIVCPDDRTVECLTPSGATVFYSLSASDDCGGSLLINCSHPPGSSFPMGTTQVACTVTDVAGKTNGCAFNVTVMDTAPPVVICPEDHYIVSGSAFPLFYFTAAVDFCDTNLLVNCTPPSSSTFPLGVTEVLCTAVDFSGNIGTCGFTVTIDPDLPPIIIDPPVSFQAGLGGSAQFCVLAGGTAPFTYQWRRNGVDLPGETGDCIMISDVQVEDGGSYSVVVANAFGAVLSAPARLTLDIPAVVSGDDLANRVGIGGANGLLKSQNSEATREPGEPNHAGKEGGNSVWFSWEAPFTGIATFRTAGSVFDTLLAVYTGEDVSSLDLVAANDDIPAQVVSEVTFNVVEGTKYLIVVDGFGGASGDLVLSWDAFASPEPLPVIVTQPVSQTVPPGADLTFSVVASGVDLSYQWILNDLELSGATGTQLMITNAGTADLGIYQVRVTSVGPRSVLSLAASLQFNVTETETQPVQVQNKFRDAINSPTPLRLGNEGGGGFSRLGGARGGGGLSLGYTGTQTLSTFGAFTEAGEPLHCGVPGGASQWFAFLSDEPGFLFLNTDGSGFDTILAVYDGPLTDFASLNEVTCDDNGGLDGEDSSVLFQVQPGVIYAIVVDGVNGATGSLLLRYSLVTRADFTTMGMTPEGGAHLLLSGRPGMKFTIQGSADFAGWLELLTTNSPSGSYDFIDLTATNFPIRYYRALMLPE